MIRLRHTPPGAHLAMLAALSLAALSPAVASAWACDVQSVPKAPDASMVANPDAALPIIPWGKKEDGHSSPVSGVFEVRRGADIVYMSGDGQYVFTGDLYNVASHNNLTEAHRRVL